MEFVFVNVSTRSQGEVGLGWEGCVCVRKTHTSKKNSLFEAVIRLEENAWKKMWTAVLMPKNAD